ncbi:MAG TPA: hypothetical protein VFL80_09920 [Thermoanaerobaculia bacterium]|nr:hypothetical protein [Thermoanaerobaculia bacterium]
MIAAVLFAVAAAAGIQDPSLVRVAEDAMVLDRVAEMSRRDLPRDLLRRMVNEDLDLLRGKRADGTYQYANYERLEAGRIEESFSIQPQRAEDAKPRSVEIKGSFVYRLIVAVPSRRMVVTRNRRVFIERVEIEYLPEGSSTSRVQSERIEQWFDPGVNRVIDFKDVARQATVRVYARADKEAGYGNVVLTLIQAKVVDNPNSPYADEVSSLKAVLRAIDNGDASSIRTLASRIQASLGRVPDERPLAAPSPAPTTAPAAPVSEFFSELQTIEDLLTGTEAEKREGLDRLHQLIRRVRPR